MGELKEDEIPSFKTQHEDSVWYEYQGGSDDISSVNHHHRIAFEH